MLLASTQIPNTSASRSTVTIKIHECMTVEDFRHIVQAYQGKKHLAVRVDDLIQWTHNRVIDPKHVDKFVGLFKSFDDTEDIGLAFIANPILVTVVNPADEPKVFGAMSQDWTHAIGNSLFEVPFLILDGQHRKIAMDTLKEAGGRVPKYFPAMYMSQGNFSHPDCTFAAFTNDF